MADVLVSGLDFGEGPRWRDGKLWYSDFYRKAVFTADLEGNETKVCDVPTQPSGLGWLPDGRLLVVSMTGRRVLRREASGELVTHGDLSSIATFHANDMCVAPSGHAWVGNFGFDLHAKLEQMEVPEAVAEVHADPAKYVAQLAHIAPDGTTRPAGVPMLFPNGMVLSDDGGTLFVNETIAFRVQAYDVGADGALSNPRTHAAFDPTHGIAPDGLSAAPDGGLFVAPALLPEVIQLDARGAIVARHACSQIVYAVAWDGGTNLFAMTAPSSEPRFVDGKGGGKIERVSL
ncbi:MAG: SMP-30/gluconolactonase/LRE family protein [Myxococcota bacterium]